LTPPLEGKERTALPVDPLALPGRERDLPGGSFAFLGAAVFTAAVFAAAAFTAAAFTAAAFARIPFLAAIIFIYKRL
jgi:hypothetical protein